MRRASAVLFARDRNKVAAFYAAVFRAEIRSSDANYTSLNCADFVLTVHQIPAHLMPADHGEPVQRREASRLGGCVDAQPPAWAGGDARFFLGHDPEGNVFGLKVER